MIQSIICLCEPPKNGSIIVKLDAIHLHQPHTPTVTCSPGMKLVIKLSAFSPRAFSHFFYSFSSTDYEVKFQRLTQELRPLLAGLQARESVQVTADPMGSQGEFSVIADDLMLFSKQKEGRFPTSEEVWKFQLVVLFTVRHLDREPSPPYALCII